MQGDDSDGHALGLIAAIPVAEFARCTNWESLGRFELV